MKKTLFFDHPLLITPCWGLTSSNLNPHLEFRNSKGKIFYTRKLKISSVVEMNRRLRMEKEAYKRQYSAIHSSPSMHSSRRVIIKPRSLTWINAHISSKGIANPHSFLSYFAKDGNKLTIPNFTLSKRQHCCRLPVINETEQFIIFHMWWLRNIHFFSVSDKKSTTLKKLWHHKNGRVREGTMRVRW